MSVTWWRVQKSNCVCRHRKKDLATAGKSQEWGFLLFIIGSIWLQKQVTWISRYMCLAFECGVYYFIFVLLRKLCV